MNTLYTSGHIGLNPRVESTLGINSLKVTVLSIQTHWFQIETKNSNVAFNSRAPSYAAEVEMLRNREQIEATRRAVRAAQVDCVYAVYRCVLVC